MLLDVLLTQAELTPRQLQPSSLLESMKGQLVKLLPDWETRKICIIFASNFFLDHPRDLIKKQTQELFAKAGKIISIGDLIPLSQLSGYFIMEGEKVDLQISFFLTPENPTLIQQLEIKEIAKTTNK